MGHPDDWLSNTTAFGYDPSSNLKTRDLPDPPALLDTFSYDQADRMDGLILSRAGSTWASIGYTRNADGNLETATPSGLAAAAETYGYDALDRLSSVTGAGAPSPTATVRPTTWSPRARPAVSEPLSYFWGV